MRKKLYCIALVVATTLALGACSGGGSSDKAGSSSPKELTYWLSGDANEGGGYAALAAKYQQETGIKINIVDIPYADFVTKLRNASQANALPDIGRVPSVDPMWMNQLVDLSQVAKDSNIMDNLLVYNDQHQLYQLPSSLTAVGLFVNKTLFDKAGVSYPTDESNVWTWDQFIAAVKKVQAATGAKYGLVMDKSSHRERSFLYQFGSNGFQKDANGKFYTNDKTKPALEFLKSIDDDKVMPKSVWASDDDPSALFKSGQVVAYYSGVWQVADFTKNITSFKWASAMMPKQPVQATNLGTNLLVAFNSNGNGEAAKKFIEWMYKPENYELYCQKSGSLPSVKNMKVDYGYGQESFDIYNTEIANSDPISGYQITSQLQDQYAGKALEGDPLRDETVKYLNGQQSVDTTISNINKLFDQQLGGKD